MIKKTVFDKTKERGKTALGKLTDLTMLACPRIEDIDCPTVSENVLYVRSPIRRNKMNGYSLVPLLKRITTTTK
jgi:hypothetical protein